MEGFALVTLVVIALIVFYKLGVFKSIVAFTSIAERESSIYNHEHKSRSVKRVLNNKDKVSKEEVEQAKELMADLEALDF